jgi:hypothetical protein
MKKTLIALVMVALAVTASASLGDVCVKATDTDEEPGIATVIRDGMVALQTSRIVSDSYLEHEVVLASSLLSNSPDTDTFDEIRQMRIRSWSVGDGIIYVVADGRMLGTTQFVVWRTFACTSLIGG